MSRCGGPTASRSACPPSLTKMIASPREAGDRHAELQARNWRVADLFELGQMAAFREETERHARLAAELRCPRLPVVRATLGGDGCDARRPLRGRRTPEASRREEAGLRAGDRNAELSVAIVRYCSALEREAFDEMDVAFVEDKIANSPAGVAYRGGYTWMLAGLGETDRAREQLHAAMELTHAFDAN